MHSPLWKYAIAAGCLLALTSVTAEAQVCGDADGNGSVSVTDGVQALRQAAGLSSSCGTGQCDVDGNGTVSVTDGVNILRKAASLPITENCPGGTTRNEQVERLLTTSLPTFGALTKFGGQSAAAGTSQLCDNSEGSFTFDQETGALTFTNCELEGFRYEGHITLFSDGFDLDITLTDLSTGEVQVFSGEFSERQSGQTFVVDGFLDFSSTVTGDFSVEFSNLVSDPSSVFFTGGSLFYTVTDATLPDVTGIEITFTPATTARVDVFLVDQSVVPFNYDLVSGQLTEIPST